MNAQKFTQKSMEAIQAAQSIALEYQNMQIEQAHLLYALLDQEEGLIGELMRKMNVQGLKEAAQRDIERLPKVSGSGREPGKVYISTDVEQALSALGELTGQSVREDITDRIFERFCVGK